MPSPKQPHRWHRAARASSLVLALTLAGPGGAQTVAPTPTSGDTVLPVVRAKVTSEPTGKEAVQATSTRIGKASQELRDVPQSVTVVTERLIDDRNIDTLKEALHHTAGVSFLAAEGGEEDIRLRGFSLQATGDIFVDGLRDPAFYERDSFNWDRLEVLRGSASMLFGRGSTGGAVNQVSKLPSVFQPSELSFTLGQAGYLRGTLDYNAKTGDNAAVRVNAVLNVADNYGAKIDKVGLAPTLRWGIGTANEFLLGYYYLDNRNGINYGLPWLDGKVLPVDPSSYYGTSTDVSLSSVNMGTLGYIHRLPNLKGQRSEWRTTLRVSRYTRDQRASAIRLAPAASQPGGQAATQDNFGPGTLLRRSGGVGTNAKIQDLDAITFQSDYDTKFQAWGMKHAVQAGVDAAQDDFIGDAALNPSSGALLKPDITAAQNRGGGGVDEALRVVLKNRDFRSKALGVYAQDLVQVTPSIKLLAGLRWDRFQANYSTFNTLATPALAIGELTAERGRTDAQTSQRLGALFQPTPLSSFHFSYGTSFNTSGDTYQFDAQGSNTPPERSRNFELGAKLDSASGGATLRLALFHATKFNERNRDDTSVNATNYVLSGQRHAAGIEIDIAGRISAKWEVYGSYAFIPDAKVDVASSVLGTTLIGENAGQRPGLTPRHSGTLWSTYQFMPKLRLGAGLNARSSMSPQQSTILAKRYVTADLLAEYDAGPVAFKLNVSNLTNQLYADSLYRGHYIVGKPRTVQLTTSAKF
jgi:catecholate siderophore receptor